MIAVGTAAPSLIGQPVFGLPFDLGAARRRGAVVVVFLPPLASRAAAHTLLALTGIWGRIDTEAGGMVIVSRSPLETARDFVPRHHVLFPMLVDGDGNLAAAWGVGNATGLAATLARARPGFLRDAVSVWRNGQPLPEDQPDQLPAAFVVQPNGQVSWTWYGRAVNDRIDPEAVWAAVRG